MPEKSLLQTQFSPSSPPLGFGGRPEPPDEVCLTSREWQEVADCSKSLYAAIHCCHGLGGVESAELLITVQIRLGKAASSLYTFGFAPKPPLRGKVRQEIYEMAKKEGKRIIIKMRSTESPYRYSTKKNKMNTSGRLQLRKYDPVVRKHVLFKEEK